VGGQARPVFGAGCESPSDDGEETFPFIQIYVFRAAGLAVALDTSGSAARPKATKCEVYCGGDL